MQRYVGKLTAFLLQKERLVLTLVLVFTLIGGIIYSLFLGDTIRFLPDEADYIQLATELSARQRYTLDGVNPSAYRAPGYPLVLAGLMLFGADIVHLRLVNYIFLVANLWLVYRILAQQSTRLGALLGVLLATAYPVLFFSAGTLYPQILAAFLLLLALDVLTQRLPSPWTVLAGGLLLGILTLTIPIYIFTLVLIPVWLWISGRLQRARYFLILFTAAFVPLAGWMVRNYTAFEAFVPLTLSTGENLLYGNSAQTTPNAGTTVDISPYELVTANFDEYDRDRYYQDQALDYIRQHPVRSAQLYILKFLNYFNFRNRLETAGQSSLARDLLMLFTYGFIGGVTLLRFFSYRRWPISSFDRLLITLYLASGLFYAIFFTRIRFRLPFDYLLVLLAAPFLEKFLSAPTEP